MIKRIVSSALTACMVLGAVPGAGIALAQESEKKPLILWYDEPCDNTAPILDNSVEDRKGWDEQSLPIGNGYMGASIWARLDTDRVQIADKTLANPYRSDPTGALLHSRGGLNSFADIYMDFNQDFAVSSNYRRSLDLRTAVAAADYEYEGVTYHREYIASYPDNVLAIKISASEPGKISFTLRPENPYIKDYGMTEGDGQGKTGTVEADAAAQRITLSGLMEYYQIQYETQIKLINDGGTVTGDESTLTVEGADSVVVMAALDTNYELEPEVFTKPAKEKLAGKAAPHDKVSARLDAAVKKGYDAVKAEHIADYKTYFDRVELDLGGVYDPDMTTDVMLEKYKDASVNRRYMEELYFQYGRYLLIASSRKGALPAHLQGAWNAYDSAPWTAGYWHNINVQMNYWPVFTANLAEMFESYEDYNKAYMYAAETGADNYLKVWGADKDNVTDHENGWGVGTGAYPYALDGPPTGSTHSGPGTSALTAMLFYDQYDFTRDPGKLEHDYKAVGGVAKFLSRAVVEHDGKYLIEHSASPENANKRISPGCAFDQQMTYEAYKETEILGALLENPDTELESVIDMQIDKLDPVLIGLDGQVKEYRDEGHYNQYADGTSGEAGHRHVSQLKGLYPGTSINDNTPAWLDGAKVTLQKRGMSSSLPGWALAHRMNLWARAKDGVQSYEAYKKILTGSTNPNLWNTHPTATFQIDGNLGAVAGVIETLMQSHAGYIELLPALSPVWTSGSVDGLVARGNFEVDIDWKNSTVTEAKIRSRADTESVSVGFDNIALAKVTDSKGNGVSFTAQGTDKITFNTQKGEEYVISDIPARTSISAPSDVSVKYSTSTHAAVKWTGTDSAEEYRVYRAVENAADYELMGTAENTVFEFDVSEEEAKKQTTYKVTAMENGRESSGAFVLLETSNEWKGFGTPIDEEDYTGADMAQNELQEQGWSETDDPMRVNENADYGAFAVKGGALVINKSSAVTVPSGVGDGNTVYSALKNFEQIEENYGGDERVTVRRTDFKGKYSVEMRIALPHTSSSSWIDFIGARNKNPGTSVGRFQNASGTISVYNNKLNTTASASPMWSNTASFVDMCVVFDSDTSTFQVFKDGSTQASKTTGTLNSGASADTFVMTNWGTTQAGAYLSGIRFAANKNMTPGDFVKLERLRLCEIEKSPVQAVDNTVEELTMDKLTKNPQSVGENLILPSSIEEGAEISWSSSRPEVIAADGTFYGAAADCDVIMTTKIVNSDDGFTAYKDFRVTVKGEMPLSVLCENGKITVKNETGTPVEATVTAAVYNEDNTLYKVQREKITANPGDTEIAAAQAEGKTLRVYVWDDNMVPLAYSK
ncbi:MAG: glycoside hydrolase family 95 protein [Clostridiales bacterium]|nr:glycoside hydrolase family 95 protein [Clostridiales bacterium]